MRGVDARRSCAVEGSHELIIHFFDNILNRKRNDLNSIHQWLNVIPRCAEHARHGTRPDRTADAQIIIQKCNYRITPLATRQSAVALADLAG